MTAAPRRDPPFDHDDPRVTFPHPSNTLVLDHLAADAAGSHPDLDDALAALGRDCGATRRAAYGVPVLATHGGVLFAVARGTRSLGLRLPDDTWVLAIEMGAVPWSELGPDWMQFDVWDPDVPSRQHTGDLRYFVEVAYRHATALEPGVRA